MIQRACPIEAVFQHVAPRLQAVQKDSQQVAISLEQLIRLLVSDGPALEAALPRLKVQAVTVHQALPAPIVLAQAPTASAEVSALPTAQAVTTPTPVTELLAEQDAAPSSEALWLPYGELEGLLRNSPGLVRPLMEALLLQSLASQAAESSAEPAPARQAA